MRENVVYVAKGIVDEEMANDAEVKEIDGGIVVEISIEGVHSLSCRSCRLRGLPLACRTPHHRSGHLDPGHHHTSLRILYLFLYRHIRGPCLVRMEADSGRQIVEAEDPCDNRAHRAEKDPDRLAAGARQHLDVPFGLTHVSIKGI